MQNNLIAVARLSMKLAAKFMRPYSHEQAPRTQEEDLSAGGRT